MRFSDFLSPMHTLASNQHSKLKNVATLPLFISSQRQMPCYVIYLTPEAPHFSENHWHGWTMITTTRKFFEKRFHLSAHGTYWVFPSNSTPGTISEKFCLHVFFAGTTWTVGNFFRINVTFSNLVTQGSASRPQKLWMTSADHVICTTYYLKLRKVFR